jgi:hypothetical protein
MKRVIINSKAISFLIHEVFRQQALFVKDRLITIPVTVAGDDTKTDMTYHLDIGYIKEFLKDVPKDHYMIWY